MSGTTTMMQPQHEEVTHDFKHIFWSNKMLKMIFILIHLHGFDIFIRDGLCNLVDFDNAVVLCNVDLLLVRAVGQWVWGVNQYILPQQGGHCVGGWLEHEEAIVPPAAHQDLVLCHSNDAMWPLQQWAGKRLHDVEAGIYPCYCVSFIVWYENWSIRCCTHEPWIFEMLGFSCLIKLLKHFSLHWYHFYPRWMVIGHHKRVFAECYSPHVSTHTQLSALGQCVVLHLDHLDLLSHDHCCCGSVCQTHSPWSIP